MTARIKEGDLGAGRSLSVKPDFRLESLNGLYPLRGRHRGSWFSQKKLVGELPELLQRYGSPLHLHNPQVFKSNIKELKAHATAIGLPLDIFFARKANKCRTYLSICKGEHIGVDVASELELKQTLDCGIDGHDIICSAAVKSSKLIELCLFSSSTIVVDNIEELSQIMALANSSKCQAHLCLRISGFRFRGKKLLSRFGVDIDEVSTALHLLRNQYGDASTAVTGLQFHLSGYDAEQRFAALDQTLELMSSDPGLFEAVTYIDIGGGLPVNYLADKRQWVDFWKAMRNQSDDERSLTFDATDLGLAPTDQNVRGSRYVYPFWQAEAGREWLAQIFLQEGSSGLPLKVKAERLGLRFRCEPGRWLLRNCGVTIAQVAHVKKMPVDQLFVSLFMNHTQCLTGSQDYMCDPYWLTQTCENDNPSGPLTGFLFGSYCTETDLITKRRLAIPAGLRRGDLILLENTAGYFMHFKESESHQIPLAKNIILVGDQKASGVTFRLDGIDCHT